jgi:hypothetical protein
MFEEKSREFGDQLEDLAIIQPKTLIQANADMLHSC